MIKIADELTREYLLDWLHHQTYERQEWGGNAYEQVSLITLDSQSPILTQTIHRMLQSNSIEYHNYKYKLDFSGTQIHRFSDKIRKPSENKVSYTVRKVSEVLN